MILNSIGNDKESVPIFLSYDIVGDKTAIPKDELQQLTNEYGYERKDYRSIFEKEVY